MKRLIALLKTPNLDDWIGGIALFVTFFVILIWVSILG